MRETDHHRLSACCDAVRELSGQLIDDGHAQRDVVNALLCELLAFNCDTPEDVERYLNGLLSRFRRNRDTIDAVFSQRAMHCAPAARAGEPPTTLARRATPCYISPHPVRAALRPHVTRTALARGRDRARRGRSARPW